MIADLLIYVATELGMANYNFHQTDNIHMEGLFFSISLFLAGS